MEEKIISYIICNMKKLQRGDIPPVEKENERNENYKGSNAQIDSERTSNNYHFIKREKSYLSYVDQRVKELGCRTKKDTVLISTFVITASPEFFKDLPPELVREYFKMCYNFFAERYGEENIVSAIVHMDETTPHMHLNLIPILDGRLCCKQLFDRTGLRNLQTDIYEQVGKYWGLNRGEKGSKTKHLDTAEYKLKKSEERAEAKEQEYLSAEINLTQAILKRKTEEQIVESLSERKRELTKEIGDLTEVKGATDRPIPLLGKDKLITALRAENAQLQQMVTQKDKELSRAINDNGIMFSELQKEQRKKDINEGAQTLLNRLKQANPTLYAELLKQVTEPNPKPPSKKNGWTK